MCFYLPAGCPLLDSPKSVKCTSQDDVGAVWRERSDVCSNYISKTQDYTRCTKRHVVALLVHFWLWVGLLIVQLQSVSGIDEDRRGSNLASQAKRGEKMIGVGVLPLGSSHYPKKVYRLGLNGH